MKEITGTMYSYSFLCTRKLWLFSNNICMEDENEDVKLGKIIEEKHYMREKKNTDIDNNINIDYLKDGIVYEIKKSTKNIEVAINQVKYYLYILNKKGKEKIKGVIEVPEERYKQEIILNNQDIEDIEKRIERINSIIKSKRIPDRINERICTQCSYYELCYI